MRDAIRVTGHTARVTSRYTAGVAERYRATIFAGQTNLLDDHIADVTRCERAFTAPRENSSGAGDTEGLLEDRVVDQPDDQMTFENLSGT